MYVIRSFESGLFTVGHYDPEGKFHPDSDHDSEERAASRVARLNGYSAAPASLTLRLYLAGQALAGLLASPGRAGQHLNVANIAAQALELADALIAAAAEGRAP